MKKETVSYVLRLGITLFLITAVVAGLLGFADFITKDKIAAINLEKSDAAKAAVLEASTYTEITDFSDATGLVRSVWKADDKGYVAECIVGGSQGDIDLMVGVDSMGACTGISVVSSSETAGLGAIAGEDSEKGVAFRSQYLGRSGGGIDAISGATITSSAVTEAVNSALVCVSALQGREGGK